MDRPRRVGGLVWVAAGIVYQLVFLVSGRARPETVALGLVTAVVVLAVITVTGGPKFVVGWITAVLLAVEFGGAVADRFGAFGGPGGKLVAWGSWDAYVGYAQRLLPWASHGLAVTAAVLATLAEAGLAVWLLSGIGRRWAGKAAAGLLTIYLVAMAFTVGFAEIALYVVPLQIGGALLVSATPARRPAVGNARPVPEMAV